MWGVRLNPEKVIWSLIVKFLAIESAFFFGFSLTPFPFFEKTPLNTLLEFTIFIFNSILNIK